MIDVCVVGGGPAGLFSAYYCQARGLKTVLLEADHQLGGRIHFYKSLEIYDLPGQFGITGEAYLQGLLTQFQQANVPTYLSTLVNKVEHHGTYFKVYTNSHTIQTKTVILAVGNGYLQMKQLPLSEEWAQYVSYELKIPTIKQRLAVIGANPMAIDWALQLEQEGHTVTLFTEKLERIQAILREPLFTSTVKIEALEQWREMRLCDEGVAYEERYFEHVFVHIGTRKTKARFPSYVSTDNGHTTISGLYVAGDIRFETGKMKLLLGAAHDAMQAANNAMQFLQEEAHYQPVVSTHDPVFKGWK